jgi:hypothetical protein
MIYRMFLTRIFQQQQSQQMEIFMRVQPSE